jgi:hypothetical protein
MRDASATRRHLVGVWNPTYEADTMDAHIALLLRFARELREEQREEDDVYVWWGKVKSPNRQAPLPHLAEILALDEALGADADGDDAADAPEVHLYLTDYRSLYVAHIGGITDDDISADPLEAPHIPAYYALAELACDCWFQLWDIRRVVLDDTPAVIEELKRLRNTRYHDRPVSLYGGMVELPLIVTRPDGARWFDERTRNQLTDGRHWVEFDAERTGAGEMQRDLRENRFGETLWSALEPAARGFIATAEQLYRTHRGDAAFDFGTVVVDLAKAVEVQVNALLRQALAGASAEVRYMNVDGAAVDLVEGGPFTLGELARAIDGEQGRNLWLKRRLECGEWFTSSLPPILKSLAEFRNSAAHGEAVAREDVARLRNQMVGVGCTGDLVKLARVRVRA